MTILASAKGVPTKPAYSNSLPDTLLARNVVRIIEIETQDRDLKEFLKEVSEHGCISGLVSSLVYYYDTVAFYEANKCEIFQLVLEVLEESGLTSMSELFGDNFDNDDKSIKETNNQNLLCWFAFEHYSNLILNDLENLEALNETDDSEDNVETDADSITVPALKVAFMWYHYNTEKPYIMAVLLNKKGIEFATDSFKYISNIEWSMGYVGYNAFEIQDLINPNLADSVQKQYCDILLNRLKSLGYSNIEVVTEWPKLEEIQYIDYIPPINILLMIQSEDEMPIAVFINERATKSDNLDFSFYASMGQHGSCSYNWLAEQENYVAGKNVMHDNRMNEFKKELEQIGYKVENTNFVYTIPTPNQITTF